ncbi:MAG: DUF1289 domain-containing protein [Chloroflexi bacterium]|nr:MAG: DUF1289 domain-containing protein [Chloroflexota bacterium]
MWYLLSNVAQQHICNGCLSITKECRSWANTKKSWRENYNAGA